MLILKISKRCWINMNNSQPLILKSNISSINTTSIKYPIRNSLERRNEKNAFWKHQLCLKTQALFQECPTRKSSQKLKRKTKSSVFFPKMIWWPALKTTLKLEQRKEKEAIVTKKERSHLTVVIEDDIRRRRNIMKMMAFELN